MPVLCATWGPRPRAGWFSCYVVAHVQRYEHRDNLFAAQFNMHKVSRHLLAASARTYTSRDEQFSWCPTVTTSIRPTCSKTPTAACWWSTRVAWVQTLLPDVATAQAGRAGAIYRVRPPQRSSCRWPTSACADWRFIGDQLDAAKLAGLAGQWPRAAGGAPDAAMTAASVHSDRRQWPRFEAASSKLGGHTAEARRNAVWTLARIDDPAARAAVRLAMTDADDDVRQAALNVVSLWRDRDAMPDLLKVLETGTPLNLPRGGPKLLGRAGDTAAVRPAAARGGQGTSIAFSTTRFAMRRSRAPGTTRPPSSGSAWRATIPPCCGSRWWPSIKCRGESWRPGKWSSGWQQRMPT